HVVRVDVRLLEAGVVEADTAPDLCQQSEARARGLKRAVRERAGKRIHAELRHTDAAVQVAGDVRGCHKKAGLRSELAAKAVIQAVAAAQDRLFVHGVGETGARLNIVAIGIEKGPRNAVDAGE